jgi:GntR family transcriptional repressor for pyruvate dehydrogenase complex
MALRELHREHLYEAAAEEIKRFISESDLKAGDRLPSEHELCQLLAVGRTSLREALRLLQMAGLVEIKVGRGVYVRQEDFESFLARTSGPLLEPTADLFDLIEVREILEVEAAKLASARRTRLHLEALERQLQQDREVVARAAYAVDDDVRFHRLLFEAAGNKVLLRFVHLIRTVTRSFYELQLMTADKQAQTLQEHTAIYEAVRDKKAGKAAGAVRIHIRTTANVILAQAAQSEPV